MTEASANPKVDFFFVKDEKWRPECKQLRSIVLDCNLAETLKWGCPCYTFEKSNIVLIHGFKEYCALLFFKGALMSDPNGILIQQTENVQAGRQIRFTGLQEIIDLESVIKSYIANAIEVEKSGQKVEYKKSEEFAMPEEFQKQLSENLELKKAFDALTPGRQRGYKLFFSAPKQSKTRESRIEKCVPKILSGKGFDEE